MSSESVPSQCPLPEFRLPFFSQWEDGNLLPVHLRVWGKRKQIPGASEGLHCFPDFQLSADLCVSRFKTLQGGEQRGAAMQEGVGSKGGVSSFCALPRSAPLVIPTWIVDI